MNPKCKHCSAWNNQAGCQSENPCPISDEPAIKTNGDRVRAMSNEEMAKFLFDVTACDSCPIVEFCFNITHETNCKTTWLDWLNSPAESER